MWTLSIFSIGQYSFLLVLAPACFIGFGPGLFYWLLLFVLLALAPRVFFIGFGPRLFFVAATLFQLPHT